MELEVLEQWAQENPSVARIVSEYALPQDFTASGADLSFTAEEFVDMIAELEEFFKGV